VRLRKESTTLAKCSAIRSGGTQLSSLLESHFNNGLTKQFRARSPVMANMRCACDLQTTSMRSENPEAVRLGTD
jgi:hypothetical protein